MGKVLSPKVQNYPGPADYYTPKTNFKGHYMGTSNRSVNMAPEKTPGPGSYKLPYFVGDVPDYAVRNRKDDQKYR